MTNTEQIILDTARAHFVSNGYAGARMQAIADDAGINKALLHYYFRSKGDLYDRVVDGVLDMLVPKIASALRSDGDFWDRVGRLVDVYVDTLLDHPEIPVFIMAELSQKREEFVEKLRSRMVPFEAIAEFIQWMHQEMEEGRLRKVPPHQLMLSVIGMLVFPFMAKPIFQTLLHVDEESFRDLMIERKQFVKDFLRKALIESNEE